MSRAQLQLFLAHTRETTLGASSCIISVQLQSRLCRNWRLCSPPEIRTGEDHMGIVKEMTCKAGDCVICALISFIYTIQR